MTMKTLQDNMQISRKGFCSFRIYLLCGYAMQWTLMTCNCHFWCMVTASAAIRHSNTWHFFITLSICSTREVGLNIPVLYRRTLKEQGSRENCPCHHLGLWPPGKWITLPYKVSRIPVSILRYSLRPWVQVSAPHGMCVDQNSKFLAMFFPYWGISVTCNADMMLTVLQ